MADNMLQIHELVPLGRDLTGTDVVAVDTGALTAKVDYGSLKQAITADSVSTTQFDASAVKFSAAQTLTDAQKAQARNNIGAASAADLAAEATAREQADETLQDAIDAEAEVREAADEAINESLATKADADGSYDEMIVGSAEQLISTELTEEKVPYTLRASGGAADIGNRETDMLVGGTIAWNQLVQSGASTVTVQNGHKYLARVNDVSSVAASTGAAISINDSTKDNVFDLTQMFGATIADYIYSLEQATAGAGVAWFKALFPKDYYAYNAGELMSVQAASHNMVGFNAYNNATGNAHVIGGVQYKITGAYTALALNGTAITPDSSGLFTPAASGILTVTGGDATTTCVNLSDAARNGEYEPYSAHEYALGDVELRGIPKLVDGSLEYDGDVYESNGTVTRRYGVVDLGTLSWAKFSRDVSFFYTVLSDRKGHLGGSICSMYLEAASVSEADKVYVWNGTQLRIRDDSYTSAADFKAAMSGVMLVYELAAPTTETAATYRNPQIVDPFGTEEYVDAAVAAGTRDVAVPVGHVTQYMADLRGKLQKIPNLPTAGGTYVLKVTVTGGVPTYSWQAQE